MIKLATQIRQNVDREFTFTEAVRPSRGVPIVPVEGYRLERFRDPLSRKRMPLLAAAISSEHLFDIFLDLLDPLGETVNVVLETSHAHSNDFHEDVCRSEIDLPVLVSNLWDFEDLLVNDGCTGIAILAHDRPIEVQFDEHKLLYVYAHDLKPFRRILRRNGVRRVDAMKLIAESEHIHHSTEDFSDRFRQLCLRIGAEDEESVLSDENGWQGSW